METEQRAASPVMRFLDRVLGGSVMSAQQILSLLFPLFLDQVFVRIISLLNTSMISSYGPEAMSAVSMVDSLNNFIVNFFIAISTGCTVVVAQYIGRRDRRSAARTAAQSITAACAIAIAISGLILLFTTPLVHALFGRGDATFQSYCEIFLRASAISYPFFALVQTGLGAMRGSGNTRTSVYFSSGLNVINVLFNVLFLFVFRMGIVGLSISMVASRVITAVVMLVYMLRPSDDYPLKARHFFQLDMPIQRSVFTVAVPVCLEQVFFHGGRILTQIFIVWFGTMSAAANTVALQFSNFAQMLGATLQMGMVTIVGQCIGAGQTDEAKRYIKRITAVSVAGSGFMSVLLTIVLPQFLGFFTLPGESYDMALKLCIINALCTPLVWSASFVTPNGLRAAGDARFTSIVALVTMWTVRVGGAYLLGVMLEMGIFGVWIAMFAEWTVRSVIFLLRLRGTKWYSHRVIQD